MIIKLTVIINNDKVLVLEPSVDGVISIGAIHTKEGEFRGHEVAYENDEFEFYPSSFKTVERYKIEPKEDEEDTEDGN